MNRLDEAKQELETLIEKQASLRKQKWEIAVAESSLSKKIKATEQEIEKLTKGEEKHE